MRRIFYEFDMYTTASCTSMHLTTDEQKIFKYITIKEMAKGDFER